MIFLGKLHKTKFYRQIAQKKWIFFVQNADQNFTVKLHKFRDFLRQIFVQFAYWQKLKDVV